MMAWSMFNIKVNLIWSILSGILGKSLIFCLYFLYIFSSKSIQLDPGWSDSDYAVIWVDPVRLLCSIQVILISASPQLGIIKKYWLLKAWAVLGFKIATSTTAHTQTNGFSLTCQDSELFFHESLTIFVRAKTQAPDTLHYMWSTDLCIVLFFGLVLCFCCC